MISKDKFPDVVRIETAGACNFECRHCPNGYKKNGRGILTVELFNILLEQFRAQNFIPRVAVLYHGGEPLLNPKTPFFIKTLRDYGVEKIKIVTNASKLNEACINNLIEAGLTDMDVSFDGESAEENNFIRKNGNFDEDAKNVKNLLVKDKIKVCVSNVKILTEKELEEYIINKEITIPSYLKEYFAGMPNVEFKSFPAMIWPGIDKSEFKEKKMGRKNINYCSALFETITILSNGNVVPCCYDIMEEVVFGNILEENVFQIWGKQNFLEYRKSIKLNKIEKLKLCLKCINVQERYLVK